MLKAKQKTNDSVNSPKVIRELLKENDVVGFYMRMPKAIRKKLKRLASEHDYSMGEWVIEQVKGA